MTPTSIGGEKQACISGGVNPPADIASGRIAEVRSRSMSCNCMTRTSQQECRGILEIHVIVRKPLFREGFGKKIPSLASNNSFAKQIFMDFCFVSGRYCTDTYLLKKMDLLKPNIRIY